MLQESNLEILLFHSRYLKQKDYWTRKLAGRIEESTDILEGSKQYRSDALVTGDSPTPPTRGHHEIPFYDELSRQLLNMCKHSELALYIFLLSALKAIIHRYTNHQDIMILSPIHGGKATQDTINSLLLIRRSLDGTMTFKELVLNLKSTVLEAYENQDYPYEKLEEFLFSSSSPTHIACWLENIHSKTDIEKIKTRLSFSLAKKGEKIEGGVLYDPGFYRESEIQRLADHFLLLLTRVGENIDTRIADIDFLTEEEKKQLLKDFNNNKVDFSRDKTLPCWFGEQVEETPDAAAIVCDHHIVTYSELNRRANRTANRLRNYNLQQNQAVGILAQRSLQMVESILAVWKAGGAYIPIDPNYPQERIDYILKNSGATLLVTTNNKEGEKVGRWEGEKVLIDEIPRSLKSAAHPLTFLPSYLQNSSNLAGHRSLATSLAYIIYTSGSTGKPKGAMVEHMGMMNHIHAKIDALQLTARSIVAQNASHTFDISVWQFFTALTLGGKTIVYPNHLVFEPDRFISRLIDDQVDILEVVPSYLSVMLELFNTDSRRLDSLKYLLVTGETIKSDLVRRWFAVYPTVKMVNAYGPTEASDDITHFIMDEAPDMIPIGKPIRNLNIYILDSYMNLCPPGIKGEICVSGVGVGRGYLNNPELTNEKFIFNSNTSHRSNRSYRVYKGNILYRTGDLGRWLPDGSIEFFGRTDHQVKIHGFRIEPGEIESWLLRYPGIKEAVVLAQEGENGDKYLCAYFVAGRDIATPALLEYLSKELPDYMIPTYFVPLEKIPLNSNGKVDRRALPLPEMDVEGEYIGPRDEIEKGIVYIVADILGTDPAKISLRTNFFNIGLNSLSIVKLAHRISEEFRIDFPMGTLFTSPSVEEVAADIKKGFHPGASRRAVLLNRKKAAKNLFLISGDGGIYIFKELALLLEGHFNVYGVQGKGIMDTTKLPETRQEIYDDFIAEIKRAQPEGPYLLGGHCFGANISYRLASILEEGKNEVAKLIFLDHHAVMKDYIMDFILVFRWYNRCLRGIETLKKTAKAIKMKLNREERADMQNTNKITRDEMPKDLQARLLEIEKNYRRLVNNMEHFSRIVTSPILFIKADGSDTDTNPLWNPRTIARMSKTSVEQVKTPGDHFSMFEVPYVSEVAKILIEKA